MGLRDSVKKFLAKTESKPPEASVPKGEVGYASASFIYQGKDFTKYNPDILYSYKGAQVYDKMMTDDQVKAVLEFKQGAVVSRGYYFDVGKDKETGEPTEEHEEIAEFFDCVLRKMDGSVTDKLIEILSAMKYGFSVCEKIFQPIYHEGTTYWGLKDIKLRPFSTMLTGMVVDQHGNLTGIKQRVGVAEIDLPLEKLIHFVHRPEIDRHYGESDLRAAYRAWWSKDIAIKFQNIHLERHAGGFIWAQIDPQKGALSNTDKTNLEKVLENLSAHTAIHVPSAVTLNTIQPLNTDAYDKAIAQYDKAISKSLLVPNLLGLSEQGSVGSYSQSSTQLEIFFWVLDLIAARLEDVLNEQLFRPLAEWNFGTDDYPPFKFELMSEDRKRTIMAAWSDMVSKGAVTKTTSDEDYIRTLIGFPEKGEADAPKPPPMFPLPGQEQDVIPPEDAEGPDELEPVEKPDNEEYLSKQPEEKQKAAKKAFAERPWLNRVNFAAIEKIMGNADAALSLALAAIMAKVRLSIDDQVIRIGGERSWGNVKPAEIIDIKIPKSLMTSFRKELRASFSDTIDAAYEGARKELPKKMFAKVKPGMDKTQTEKFLASKAMKITGVVERRVLDNVQLILENAIKYDKALKDVIKAMEDDADFMALLPKVDAAGRAVNVPARLENIARTNIADAVNQSRMALFQDPALKGFVVAYEYSAILDDQTTELCEKLHGKIERDWGVFVPPNHYGCRSALIPVTQVDDWDGKEDKIPSGLKPMKGFA